VAQNPYDLILGRVSLSSFPSQACCSRQTGVQNAHCGTGEQQRSVILNIVVLHEKAKCHRHKCIILQHMGSGVTGGLRICPSPHPPPKSWPHGVQHMPKGAQ
jgi:hypothetical protein